MKAENLIRERIKELRIETKALMIEMQKVLEADKPNINGFSSQKVKWSKGSVKSRLQSKCRALEFNEILYNTLREK